MQEQLVNHFEDVDFLSNPNYYIYGDPRNILAILIVIGYAGWPNRYRAVTSDIMLVT